MNDIEERLRAVTRAAAGQIPPTGVHPLRLPAPSRLRRTGVRLAGLPGLAGRPGLAGAARTRWHRWQAWLTPVAAAAAMAGLAAGSLTLAHAADRHPATQPPAGGTALAALPPYYLGLAFSAKLGTGAPGSVLVRATSTGKELARITPPAGLEFTAVSAAADDRTFVLAAETHAQVAYRIKHAPTQSRLAAADGPERFYLVHLDPAGTPSRPEPLNIPVNPDESGFSLSPDGTRLAVALSAKRTLSIQVYSVATGAARTWTTSTYRAGKYRYEAIHADSWTAGGMLDVLLVPTYYEGYHPPGTTGLLNTATPGGDLTASLTTIPWSCAGTVTPDGRLLVGVALHGRIPWVLRECAYRYGQTTVTVPGRILYYQGHPVDLDGPFWLSPSGSTMITGGVTVKGMAVTGVLAGNQIEPLPGNAAIAQSSLFPGAAVAW
jgi:hypothetical protein